MGTASAASISPCHPLGASLGGPRPQKTHSKHAVEPGCDLAALSYPIYQFASHIRWESAPRACPIMKTPFGSLQDMARALPTGGGGHVP